MNGLLGYHVLGGLLLLVIKESNLGMTGHIIVVFLTRNHISMIVMMRVTLYGIIFI